MRRSKLQKQVMFYLSENRNQPTITQLAQKIGFLRPAVSRSLRALGKQGLICKDRFWQLTEKGEAEVKSFFVPAMDIVWSYGDLHICFYCSCGQEVLLSQEENENIKSCDCGRIYRFGVTLEVGKRTTDVL